MTVSADEGVRDSLDSAVKQVDVHYDRYDADLNRDPHPMFSRIREQAPLYSNAEPDSYVLSRYPDVDAALLDHETFSSARGAVLESVMAGLGIPLRTLIFEDPPIHNIRPRQRARMTGGMHRAGRDPSTIPALARRPHRCRAQPDVHNARMGHDARRGGLTDERYA